MKHEEIQKFYKNHILLSYKDMGVIKRLVGDVVVIVFFVDDAASSWTVDDRVRFRERQNAAVDFLSKNARARGVNLRLRTVYADMRVNMDCDGDNFQQWSEKVISRYYNGTVEDYQNLYERRYKCDEAPILFVFNKRFRSYAVTADWDLNRHGEYAMVSSVGTERTIVHELLHQFGAKDYYYIEELNELFRLRGYKSIMGKGLDMNIDSLTAYLIGWTREIDDAGIQILERTRHITKAEMNRRLDLEWLKKF